MSADPNPFELHLPKIRKLLFGIFLILVAQVVYFAQDVIMPLMLGILVAFTLSPLVRIGRRIGIPEWISALLVMTGFGLMVALLLYSLSGPFTDLVNSAPQIKSALSDKLSSVQSHLQSLQRVSEEAAEVTGQNAGEGAPEKVVVDGPPVFSGLASTVAGALGQIAIAMFLALFILASGKHFYEGIVKMAPTLTDKKIAVRILYDVEKVVSRYLLTITVINICLGAAIGFSLWLYGMSNPFLWGTIAALLNFLPYIGAVIGALAIGLTAIAEFPTLGAALGAPFIYYALTAIEGNIITPLLLGRRLEMNIVAVFVSVVLWGWMWGFAGALMAVPILVILKVMSDNIESMAKFGNFLSAPVHDDEREAEEAANEKAQSEVSPEKAA
ncbi:AI-2E family transporter [Notoacmeibacter sp. MSK16QG-6]|uniref:AI-2E family transporter n=1 Tax=Notoacmeibacter sp. MSK16QG-6 TaxID=2957982 RepID=UPI00209ED4BE|nr:AI-2E family transporter [Notoacmeibacter sp. MSK16QG-6]MCP1199020.1 AI-2E family transporter [Notoacmeibacter sp. MSK16QG-6]